MGMINDIATWNYTRGLTNYESKHELTMLTEEVLEYTTPTSKANEAKEIADIIFVAVGSLYKLSGSAYKAEAIMAEVIKSNFKKGATKDENGKVVKAENMEKAEVEIENILEDTWGTYTNKNEHIYG